MIRIGMNPLVEERMLGNFNAKNTKERAAAPKKKVHLSSFFVIPFSMSSLSHWSCFCCFHRSEPFACLVT
jgi:hypothetical protein